LIVIPEVEAVDVSVVEPHPRMVRMVDALSWPGFKRIAARHRDSFISDQWIQNRLLQRCRPDVRGERLAVDSNVDTLMRLIGNNLNPFACCVCHITAAQPKTSN
jgi:hypothetical protein